MKSNTVKVDHANELKTLIDDIAKVVRAAKDRGFVPTFSVKAGIVGMVATYAPNLGAGKPGRPRKVAEVEVESDYTDSED